MTWRAGHYVAAGALAAGMLVWAAHEAWPSREIPVALPIVVTSAYDEWADTLRRGQVFSDVLARGGITGREYVAFMKATHTLNPRRMQPGLIFQLRRVKGAWLRISSESLECGRSKFAKEEFDEAARALEQVLRGT